MLDDAVRAAQSARTGQSSMVDLTAVEPLGWVDDMPALMRASDVVVQNAGGLTSLVLRWRTMVNTFQRLSGESVRSDDFPMRWVVIGSIICSLLVLGAAAAALEGELLAAREQPLLELQGVDEPLPARDDLERRVALLVELDRVGDRPGLADQVADRKSVV